MFPRRLLLLALVTSPAAAQLHGVPIRPLSALNPLLDTTGFRGTVLVYDLQRHRLLAIHPELADARRLPASTFKIANSLIALETGVIADESAVIPWDSVVRDRIELNHDLTLTDAFRLSAVPHYQSLARAIGGTRMKRFIDALNYGNRAIGGAVDEFWLAGDLRISPREQIEFLVRLYRRELPVSTRAMDIVRRMMTVETRPGSVLRAKTGWTESADGRQVGWWVGWVENPEGAFFFACMIEADRPDPAFSAARTGVARRALQRLGIF